MELSYEAKRRVAPASCWPRPSDAGTSACSGVSSVRVTAPLALRGPVRHPAPPGVNLAALDPREAKGAHLKNEDDQFRTSAQDQQPRQEAIRSPKEVYPSWSP